MKKLIIIILLLISCNVFAQIDLNKNLGNKQTGLKVPVSTGFTYDTSALAYFNKMLIQPPDEIKAVINTFILGMKTAGFWTRMDRVWNMKMNSERNARIDMITLDTMSRNIRAEVNSSFDYERFSSFRNRLGEAGYFINTNYNPCLDSINYGLNKGHFSIWMDNIVPETGNNWVPFGVYSASGNGITLLYFDSTYSSIYSAINHYANWGSTYTQNIIGLWFMNRSAYNAEQLYRNDSLHKTLTTASSTVYNSNWGIIGAFRPSLTYAYLVSKRKYPYASVGGSFSGAEQSTYYNLVKNMKDDIDSIVASKTPINIVCSGNFTIANSGFEYFDKFTTLLNDYRPYDSVFNYGVPNITLDSMNTLYANAEALKFNASKTNILVVYEGTHTLYQSRFSSDSTFQKMKRYCLQGQATGYKVFVCTTLPGDQVPDTARINFNNLLRLNYTDFADGLVDLASDVVMGDTATLSNTTYYSSLVYPTYNGNLLLVPYVSNAIRNKGY